jgi:hypothetical protein
MLTFMRQKDATLALWSINREPKRLLSVSRFANTIFEITHHPMKRCIVSCSAGTCS